MTDVRTQEIRCRTRLTAMQLVALLVPSPGSGLFAIVFCFIWITAVPASTIATTLAVGLASLLLLKSLIFLPIIYLNSWRVKLTDNRADFHQGSRIVATTELPLENADSITIVENLLFPRMLRVTKHDGSILDTLYGVARDDLETVAARIRSR